MDSFHYFRVTMIHRACLNDSALRVDKLIYLVDILLQCVNIADDKTHRVVDLVGDSGSQLTDRCHLFLLEYLRLNCLELGISRFEFAVFMFQSIFSPLLLSDVSRYKQDASDCPVEIDDRGKLRVPPEVVSSTVA